MVQLLDRFCAHCGNRMRGVASKTVRGRTYWLCHPDEGMDCYRLVTLYHHELNTACAKCADPKGHTWSTQLPL